MNTKWIVFVFLFIAFDRPLPAAQPASPLSAAEEALMEHMVTPAGAELSALSVADVENLLRPLLRTSRIGGQIRWSNSVEYHIITYRIDLPAVDARHEVELLTIPTKDDSLKWKVVNVRFIYQVLNGPAYYNYLIPIDWPFLRGRADKQ